MTYKYRHKKTGGVITREKPMTGKQKNDYILVSWIRNMIMKANEIMKK